MNVRNVLEATRLLPLQMPCCKQIEKEYSLLTTIISLKSRDVKGLGNHTASACGGHLVQMYSVHNNRYSGRYEMIPEAARLLHLLSDVVPQN